MHRVQRVPETETGGRIHTSTATVAVLPEMDAVEVYIDPKDPQIDTYRSSTPAASMSTRPKAPSASRTCRPARSSSARMSAASIKTRIKR